jgi:hypothetical protein
MHIGVELTKDLRWKNHINQISAKGNRALGFVKRNLSSCTEEIKLTAFNTLVRPTIEYCSAVWDPHTHLYARRLEMVQRRAARWVTGRFNNTSSVSDMLSHLGWRSLAQRRVDSRLVMMYKISKGFIDIPVGEFFEFQRDGIHIKPIFARTQYYQFSYFPRTISDWNSLPPDILRANTLATFKRKVATLSHTVPY